VACSDRMNDLLMSCAVYHPVYYGFIEVICFIYMLYRPTVVYNYTTNIHIFDRYEVSLIVIFLLRLNPSFPKQSGPM